MEAADQHGEERNLPGAVKNKIARYATARLTSRSPNAAT